MWSPSSRRERLAVAGATVVVALLLVVGLVAATAAPPSVNEVSSSWGEVRDEATIVRSNVSLTNPNPYPVPPVLRLGARLWLNDVVVGPASTESVSIASGNDTLLLTTRLAHDRIPTWWPTHINNGERTMITVEPVIRVPVLDPTVPNRTRTFETDFLAAFETDSAQTVTIGDRTILNIAPLEATWGTATENRTPVHITTTLTNPRDRAVEFERLEYTIRMNSVRVANGSTNTIRVPAQESTELSLDIDIENDKLADWWPTHIRNGERTRLNVSVVGVVTVDGDTERVPLRPLSSHVAFTTHLLGNGSATVRQLDGPTSPSVTPPTLDDFQSEWTSINDTATEISASAVIRNPNPADSMVTQLLSLETSFTLSANDVRIAAAERSGIEVESGTSEIQLVDVVPGERIERWWVSHINNGERTTQKIRRRAIADLGFTVIPLRSNTTRRIEETNVIDAVKLNNPRHVRVRGERVLTVEDADATWGRATMNTTPVDTSLRVHNPSSVQLTVTRIEYRATMNDIVMADGAQNRSFQLDPGATRTLTQRVPLDTNQVDRWWVTHLDNDQESTVSVEYRVFFRSRGETYNVTLDAFETTIETAFLTNSEG